MPADTALTSTDVVAALQRHYGDGWKLVEQVAQGTGYRANRHLDIVAFGLWPSRGLEIVGIEVKVSRHDLERELKDPAKADEIAAFCDRFYLAAPAGVADPWRLKTVAPTWGLLEVDKAGKIQTAIEAAKLTPKPIDRAFVAAVMRRLASPTEQLRAELRAAVQTQYSADVERGVEAGVAHETKRYQDAIRQVEQFREALGIDVLGASSFDRPNPEKLAAAVRFVYAQTADRWTSTPAMLTLEANRLDGEAKRLAEAAEELRAGAAALAVLSEPVVVPA